MDNSFIQREIATVIKEACRYFPVIILTGPRQTGKTTLIKNMFPELPYYSMENPDLLNYALNDPIGFLTQQSQGMVLDEVQNAPVLLSYIQGLADDNPKIKFILSGSAQFSMIKSITQSLAGRAAIFELLPFSYREVADLTGTKIKSVDELIFEGFYPAIYAGKNIPAYLYPNYVRTYLERDVRDILQVKDLRQFQIFLRLCAGRIGSLFNSSELSNEIGVAVNTIKSWLSVLQTSYIITLLTPFYENIGKRLIKTPKLYFNDTGLACYLLGIESAQQLARDKMRGPLFENLIVSEALKTRTNKGKENNLCFYRDSHQNEVDLLWKEGNSFSAVEIKSSQTYHPDFEKGLKILDNVLGNRLTNKAIVYTGEFENNVGNVKVANFRNFSKLI
jgi:predicted AAA+ superfamily ATPase